MDKNLNSNKIFFSYGHDINTPLVLKIKEDLEREGYAVWVDKHKIRAGDEWRKKIVEGLIDTDKVLSFLSVHSVRNPGVCLDELRIALGLKHGNIKTILLENEGSVSPPATVSDVQWLDLSDWKEHGDINSKEFNEWYSEKFNELRQLIENDESVAYCGDITTLKQILNPYLSDSKEQYLLNRQYLGRKWLDEELLKWKEDRSSKAFVLLGSPGIGKSAFATHAMHYDSQIVCGIFCEWDKSSSTNPITVIKSMAFKLATKIPDYRTMLLHKLEANLSSFNSTKFTPNDLFDYLLTDVLSLLIDGGRKDVFILIDGLDETIDNEGLALVDTLVKNIRKTPAWIRFIITSRPESNLVNILSPYSPHVLLPDNSKNISDIKQYILYELQPFLLDKTDRLSIVADIVDNCEGSFLYATLFVDEIKKDAKFLDDIGKYPKGLDEFYTMSFGRRFKTDDNYILSKKLLEYLLALQNLPNRLIKEFLFNDGYEYNSCLHLLSSFIKTNNFVFNKSKYKLECISLCHKSLMDWLSSENRSGNYYIDYKNGAISLARIFRERLSEIDKTYLYDEPYEEDILCYKFMQENITKMYIAGKQWGEIIDFMCEKTTPLTPYWDAVVSLPRILNTAALAERFIKDSKNLEYLLKKQSEGSIEIIIRTIEILIKHIGLSQLPTRMFVIYTDAIHLSGKYKEAVELDEKFLSSYSIEQVVSDKELLHIYSRMLHHSKFFCPISELLDKTTEMVDKVRDTDIVDEYCELLIMQGNLGTLMGNIALSKESSKETIQVAKAHGLKNYELRGVRKSADLLIYERKYQEAENLILSYIDESNTDNLLRYELYLFGSLGEAYCGLNDFHRSYTVYDILKKKSKQAGIQGWYAHSNLGIGKLMALHGYYDEAKIALLEAEKIYGNIEQEWGIINSNIVKLDMEIRQNGKIVSTEILDSIEEKCNQLGYSCYTKTIKQLRENKKLNEFSLLFI